MPVKIERAVFSTAGVLYGSYRPVYVPGNIEKQFPPLWRSCEARIGQLLYGERSRKQFSPLWRSCEARIGLFMYRETSRKQFWSLLRSVTRVQCCLSGGKVKQSRFNHRGSTVKLV